MLPKLRTTTSKDLTDTAATSRNKLTDLVSKNNSTKSRVNIAAHNAIREKIEYMEPAEKDAMYPHMADGKKRKTSFKEPSQNMLTKMQINNLRNENRKINTKLVVLENQLAQKDKLFEDMYKAAFT